MRDEGGLQTTRDRIVSSGHANLDSHARSQYRLGLPWEIDADASGRPEGSLTDGPEGPDAQAWVLRETMGDVARGAPHLRPMVDRPPAGKHDKRQDEGPPLCPADDPAEGSRRMETGRVHCP